MMRNEAASDTDSDELTVDRELILNEARARRRDRRRSWRKSWLMMAGGIRVNPLSSVLMASLLLFLVYVVFLRSSSSVSSELSRDDNLVSLKFLLTASIEAARRGGREVKAVRTEADIGEKSKGKTKEGANNPVTDGDMRSHRIMYNTLIKAFPKVNVVSEESDNLQIDLNEIDQVDEVDNDVENVVESDMLVPASEVDVWIDPLDATQEYTENLLNYVTTMVCVAIRGKPVIGVIHKPFEDETIWGWSGLNYVSPTVASAMAKREERNEDSQGERIIVSRSHSGSVNEVAQKAFGENVKVTPAGGAGFKTWEVLKGTEDAYVHVTLIKKWDICAGNAILEAVGGRLTTLRGEDVDYSGSSSAKNEGGVLATMHRHDHFLSALKDALVTKRP